MMHSKVIVGITISRGSFVFSQSRAKVSASLTNVGSLPVSALHYTVETGRNLSTRLTEHKRATRNGDANNHIAVHHQLTNHNIDWDSAQCLTYSTNYFLRLTLEGWYTNLQQTPLKRVPYNFCVKHDWGYFFPVKRDLSFY